MNVPEDWVPSEAPEDHWSKSKEWLEYKAQQAAQLANFQPAEVPTKGFMKPGTIIPGTRQKTTHEIAMDSLRVEWVNPNPDAPARPDPIAAVEAISTELLEEIAKKILSNVNKAVDAAVTGQADAETR